MTYSPGHQLKTTAETLRSIAHPARLRIIGILGCCGYLSVTNIQKRLGVSQSLTSQHLAVLHRQGVVSCHKQGNVCYYLLEKRVLQGLIPYLQKTCRKTKALTLTKRMGRVIPFAKRNQQRKDTSP